MGKRSLSPYVDGSLRRGVTSRKFREDPAHSFVDRSTRTNIFTQRGAILSCLSIVPGIDERHDVVHHGVTRTRVSMLQPRLNAPLQGRVAVYGGRLRIDDIFPLSSWTFAFFFFFCLSRILIFLFFSKVDIADIGEASGLTSHHLLRAFIRASPEMYKISIE